MDENTDYFLQRLKFMRAECIDTIQDDSIIQGNINNYYRYLERKQILTEIIDLYEDSEKDSRNNAALNSKFNGTTIY